MTIKTKQNPEGQQENKKQKYKLELKKNLKNCNYDSDSQSQKLFTEETDTPKSKPICGLLLTPKDQTKLLKVEENKHYQKETNNLKKQFILERRGEIKLEKKFVGFSQSRTTNNKIEKICERSVGIEEYGK